MPTATMMPARIEYLENRLFLSTYYVSPKGNDAGAGSAANPFLTLQQAADTVAPGDKVVVKPGTYVGFNLTTSGTPSARITFQAEPGVLVDDRSPYNRYAINLEGASYITIDGFKVAPNVDTTIDVGIRSVENSDVIIRNNIADHATWWGILASFADNVLIENNTTSNSIVQHGIYVADSSHNPVIRNNLIFGNAQAGLHLNGDATNGGDGLVTNALIEYNTIYGNGKRGGSAINGDGLQYSTIQHNLLYDNVASGISLYRIDGRESATHNLVLNNTILMPAGARWAVNIQDGSTDNVLYNNIITSQDSWRGSIDISPDSLPGLISNYNVLTPRFSTNDAPGEMDLAGWQAETGQDLDSLVSTPTSLFVNPAQHDYRLSSTSPAIDAGNPLTYFFREPSPNGGRVNIGHQGNTPQATPSPAQSVQLLAPNGGQRLELGQPVTISWQSAGLASQKPVALINAGSSLPVGDYLPDAYQLIAGSNGSFDHPVNTSTLTDPAPSGVYTTYAAAQPGIGNRLAWRLPVPDGTYTLRLHFADPVFDQPDHRKFDIQLQNAPVASAFDIAALTKSTYAAVISTFSVVATGGAGIRLDLVNVTDQPAILSAIELTQPDSAAPAPTVNLEFTNDDGRSWLPIASKLPIDRFGRGSYQWTPTSLTDSTRVRITANTKPVLSDISNDSFRIVNNGHDFYINDDSTDGDVFTTAPGNNANTGKSSDQPLASLGALLAIYDLGPGDIVHVDTGTYHPLGNIILTARHSGVRIEGPSTATALFDRASRTIGSYDFELRNAHDITLDHLSLTGGQYAIYASDQSNSDRLTLSNSILFANDDGGVWLGSSNDYATLSSNTLYGVVNHDAYDDQVCGITIAGAHAALTGNTLRDNAFTGIRITGPDAAVTGNTVTGSRSIGIFLAAGTASGNTVHHNGIGIALTNGAAASDNTVHDNYDGIVTADSPGPGPFSLWNDSVIPEIPAEEDSTPVDIGVRFRSDVAGYVTAIRFYKGPGNVDTHTGYLWDNDSNLISSVIFTAETDTGWQTMTFPSPIPIAANTTYVASYHTDTGFYSVADGYFDRFAQDSGPLHALPNNFDGPNGAYYYAQPGDVPPNFPFFPTSSTNYFVDVVFTPSLSTDILYQPGSAVVTHNRVYNNSHTGIVACNDSAISDNLVYSNPTGIRALAFTGQLTNNLVYANSEQAISLSAASAARITNNTVYQPQGNALRIEDNSQALRIFNNILLAPAGLALSIAPDSQTDLASDYNLFAPTAGILASWNGSDCRTLADWQYASGNDSHSLAADPGFVDPAGPDKILGGAAGADDDFHLSPFSPAIDSAQTQAAPLLDLEGSPRHDDPGMPNTGSLTSPQEPGYVDRGAYEFQGASVAPTLLTLTETLPSALQAPLEPLTLRFSKPLNVADALNPINYELRSAGPDRVFGTLDDGVYPLQPHYAPNSVTLILDYPTGPLPPASYRLTVFSSPGGGLHDLAGARFDGDSDGSPGGNFVTEFILYPATLEFTPGPDSLYLRLSPADPTLLQVFHNTSTDAPPAYSFPLAVLQSLTLSTLAGDDSLTLDFSNGNPIPPRGLAFNAGIGSDALRVIGTPAADSLSLDASRLLFGNSPITYSDVESMRLDTAAGDDSLTLTAALPFTPVFNPGPGNATLSIRAGSYNLTPDNLLAAPNLNLIASGAASLTLHAPPRLSSLAISDTARVQLAPGLTLLQTQSLSIASTAALDLTDGRLIVECPGQSTAVLAAITDYVRAGRNNGAWTGLGITSSVIKSSPHHSLATLLHDPSLKSVIRSPLITPPSVSAYVLVLYSLEGDLNADGVIDAADYFRMDSAFITEKTGYQNGDLNYDGDIDAADYFLMDSAFIAQKTSRAPISFLLTPAPSPLSY